MIISEEYKEDDKKVVLIKNIIPKNVMNKLCIEYQKNLLDFAYDISGKIFTTTPTENTRLIFITKDPRKEDPRKEDPRKEDPRKEKLHKGDLLIIKNKEKNYPGFVLYEDNLLKDIYTTIANRIEFASVVNKQLKKYKNDDKCIQQKLNLTDLIGTGCYGNVFRDGYFAVKITQIKNTKPSMFCSSWTEFFILSKMIRPIITAKKCPNLPLLIDVFTCEKCTLLLDKKKECPCITMITELANGDFKNFVKNYTFTESECLSVLFQIMAGLYAIQKYPQIMNFDIKKENILFYDITKGGYWCYKIKNQKFYIPNFGKLFVINDFGLSRSMSPEFKLRKKETDNIKLGTRCGFVKDGKILPLFKSIKNEKNIKIKNKKKGMIEFKMDINGKVLNEEIPFDKNMKEMVKDIDFFLEPDIIPPFEFYNDTQDVIRMFTGGKRTTQEGFHKEEEKIPESLKVSLKKYIGKGDNMKAGIFSENAYQMLAGEFIIDFFKDTCKDIFKELPKGEIILDTFVI